MTTQRNSYSHNLDMKIEAIKVQRLYLQVADQITEQIHTGTIAYGQRLPSERELATSFGVSRPTIREATVALELAGLVEVRSGSGVYVLRPKTALQKVKEEGDPGPIEILEARLLFESDAAALAAERASDQLIEALGQSLLSLSEAGVGAKELHDREFHLTIAHASGNSAIESTITWLWDLRDASAVSQFFHERLRSAGVEPVIADHKAIYDAIVARDPEAARSAMHEHLNRVMSVVLDNSDN